MRVDVPLLLAIMSDLRGRRGWGAQLAYRQLRERYAAVLPFVLPRAA